jgi:hypothetical protein
MTRLFFLLMLVCGTAWGQPPQMEGFPPWTKTQTWTRVLGKVETTELDSVLKLTPEQQNDYYDRRIEVDRAPDAKQKATADSLKLIQQTTADSLRLIRQVDIVLDYLKERGMAFNASQLDTLRAHAKPMYLLEYNGFRFWSPDSVAGYVNDPR